MDLKNTPGTLQEISTLNRIGQQNNLYIFFKKVYKTKYKSKNKITKVYETMSGKSSSANVQVKI